MLTRMDLRATYKQMSIFMDHSDMVAMITASGMAAIKPIFPIALGIVSMICPICKNLSPVSRSAVTHVNIADTAAAKAGCGCGPSYRAEPVSSAAFLNPGHQARAVEHQTWEDTVSSHPSKRDPASPPSILVTIGWTL